jgi:phage gp36-like protein
MGNYAVAADVKARFASVAEGSYITDNEAAGVWDDTKVDAAIELAEAEVNARIGQRYVTPVDVAIHAESARFLKYLTVELAEVHLLRRVAPMSDEKQRQRDQALEALNMIREGKAVVPGAVTLPSTTSRNPRTSWSDASRVQPDDSARLFTRDTCGRI